MIYRTIKNSEMLFAAFQKCDQTVDLGLKAEREL
jgi:hypothetical protein